MCVKVRPGFVAVYACRYTGYWAINNRFADMRGTNGVFIVHTGVHNAIGVHVNGG